VTRAKKLHYDLIGCLHSTKTTVFTRFSSWAWGKRLTRFKFSRDQTASLRKVCGKQNHQTAYAHVTVPLANKRTSGNSPLDVLK